MGGLTRRIGKAGAAKAPGAAARRTAPVMLVAVLLLLLLAGERYWHDRDLRELSGLQPATATVEGTDFRRRLPDLAEVRFEVDGQLVEQSVPYDGPASPGDTVEVAHLPGDPSRVRTVEGWAPAHVGWLVNAGALAVVALLVGGFGLLSRWRRSSYEEGQAVAAPETDELGVRVVGGSFVLQGLFLGLAVLCSAPLFWSAAVRESDRQNALGGIAVLLGVCAIALGFHLYWGRDGVWSTPTELVGRRRGRLRRWPWAQVHELGVVVEKGSATVAAARVDDGEHDGVGVEGWVTLARPLGGPLVSHRWGRHLQDLAAQRGLPYTEGLRSSDLADSLSSTYIRGRGAVG